MGTLNAIYVRTTDKPAIAALKKKYPKATTESGSDFFWIPRSEDNSRCPEKELLKLSAQLKTDVLWLSFQSNSDSFQFHHWCAGQPLRSLVYQITQEGWERVEGVAEPWEQKAFFDPRHLEIYLECASSAAEKREFKRIFRDADLAAGQTAPSIDAKNTAWAVGEHYRLPGWLPATPRGKRVTNSP